MGAVVAVNKMTMVVAQTWAMNISVLIEIFLKILKLNLAKIRSKLVTCISQTRLKKTRVGTQTSQTHWELACYYGNLSLTWLYTLFCIFSNRPISFNFRPSWEEWLSVPSHVHHPKEALREGGWHRVSSESDSDILVLETRVANPSNRRLQIGSLKPSECTSALIQITFTNKIFDNHQHFQF